MLFCRAEPTAIKPIPTAIPSAGFPAKAAFNVFLIEAIKVDDVIIYLPNSFNDVANSEDIPPKKLPTTFDLPLNASPILAPNCSNDPITACKAIAVSA